MAGGDEEFANFSRLVKLIVNVGSDVLRDVLVHVTRPQTLENTFKTNLTTINRLYYGKPKVLFDEEFTVLSKKPPNPEDFDITLLVKIFRNICTTICPPVISPNHDWNNPPGQTDISLADDIHRVRDIRNSMFAHIPNTNVTYKNFQTKWSEVREVILRISGHGSPGLKQQIKECIDNLKTETIDQSTFQGLLKTLREQEKNHKETMGELKKMDATQTEIRCTVGETRTTVGEINKKLDILVDILVQRDSKSKAETDVGVYDKDDDQFEDQEQGVKVGAHRLPPEILRMDNKSIELFKKALEDGKEKDHNIRLMVVGPFGVGKTAFTKRLLCQDVDINERKSTNGIDIHVRKCRVSLKKLDWTVGPADLQDDNTLKRLANILGNTSQSDTDESISQSFKDNDSYDAGDQEEMRTYESDIAPVEQKTAEQNQNSADAITKGISTALSDSWCAERLNDSDRPDSENNDLLLKDLKELVKAGDNCDDDDTAIVSVWDFGGQPVFYTTHQMFLSHRAIYILVNDLSQDIEVLVEDDKPYYDCSGMKRLTMEDPIDIWLNSIHGHSKYGRAREPPVLLVGTHTDKLKPDQKEEQIKTRFKAIRKRFAGEDASLHFRDEDFGLSNATIDPKLNDLRQKIIEVAKQQSHWGELKPAKWIRVERLLEDLRKSGLEIVSRTDLEEKINKLPVPISSEEERDLFLRFQHEVGHIMYFSLPKLRNKIVLSPQFLVNALKSLITAEEFCLKRPEVLGSWEEFEKKGLLKSNLLDAVWKNNENTRFEENRGHILALMEHLNIIARPINYAKNAEARDSISTKEQDCFLVPCMLKQAPPNWIFQSEESYTSTPCLCLKLGNIAFPSAIFNRLLVACISRWPVATLEDEYLMYCGYGQYDVYDQHRLTLSLSSNIIGLKIVRYCKTDEYPSSTVCKDVYNMVKQSFRSIGDGLSLEIKCEEFVKCPLGKDSFKCLHAVDKLKSRHSGDFPCYGHAPVETLNSSDLLKYWFDAEEPDQELTLQKTAEGDDLHKRALRRCRVQLIKELHFESIIDYMESKDVFPQTRIRDMKDEKYSTHRTRALLDNIEKVPSAYKIFLTGLQKTKQDHLRTLIEKESEKLQMKEIRPTEKSYESAASRGKLDSRTDDTKQIFAPLSDVKSSSSNVADTKVRSVVTNKTEKDTKAPTQPQSLSVNQDANALDTNISDGSSAKSRIQDEAAVGVNTTLKIGKEASSIVALRRRAAVPQQDYVHQPIIPPAPNTEASGQPQSSADISDSTDQMAASDISKTCKLLEEHFDARVIYMQQNRNRAEEVVDFIKQLEDYKVTYYDDDKHFARFLSEKLPEVLNNHCILHLVIICNNLEEDTDAAVLRKAIKMLKANNALVRLVLFSKDEEKHIPKSMSNMEVIRWYDISKDRVRKNLEALLNQAKQLRKRRDAKNAKADRTLSVAFGAFAVLFLCVSICCVIFYLR